MHQCERRQNARRTFFSSIEAELIITVTSPCIFVALTIKLTSYSAIRCYIDGLDRSNGRQTTIDDDVDFRCAACTRSSDRRDQTRIPNCGLH